MYCETPEFAGSGLDGNKGPACLNIGDVVCAERECYGDLGAATRAGFLDMKALGFPVVDPHNRGKTSPPLYNELPMQIFPVERRVPFVTVSSCSGTGTGALAVEQRTGGAVENMEGAAIAHVAHLHGIPAGELRGISNLVGDRNPGACRLNEAAVAAQEALVSWIIRR